ncbi:unnamed protein product [Ambrosiozyma monospora]|uniref:Unnamed protein product n=1 Tax=Ambrosiozyma monospora TaxID=43982 RepID=A0ACB5U118_AMBMO|nr:unnamed protein product [Ambrosiozyma monospora]
MPVIKSNLIEIYDYPLLVNQLELFYDHLKYEVASLPSGSSNLNFQLQQFHDSYESFKLIYKTSNGFRMLRLIPKSHDDDMDPYVRAIIELNSSKLFDEQISLRLIYTVDMIAKRLKQLPQFKFVNIELFRPYKKVLQEMELIRENHRVSRNSSLSSSSTCAKN